MDTAIIILAIISIVQVILWIILLLVLIFLALKIRGAVDPILKSGKATATNVQATSVIISETTVKPFIRVAAFISGVRRALGVLSGFSRRRGGE